MPKTHPKRHRAATRPDVLPEEARVYARKVAASRELSIRFLKEAGIIAIVLSALWLANSLWLGKRQEVLAEQQAIADRNNAEAPATA